MGRGPKPAKGKAKPAGSRKSPKNEGAKVRDLEKRLAETVGQLQTRDRELVAAHAQVSESHEQQTATAEILRVISQSPTDLTPVARAIAENAARLCETTYTAVFRFDGELIHWVAAKGASAAQEEVLRGVWPRPADHETLVGRTILAGETLHIEDATADPTYTSGHHPLRRVMPAALTTLAIGSLLNVPMLRDGRPLGVIGLIRSEVRPFSAREIALVQTFADQAVIAIENVRLFTETKEALEQQTATSEILRVISSSPTDVQPVFEAIAANAVRLCGAVNSAVFRFDGKLIHLATSHNISGDILAPFQRLFPATLDSPTVTARAISSRATVHVEDLSKEYENTPVVQAGYRTVLSVPMMREGVPIGAVNVTRMEVQPFSPNQVALLQTFADQAVIAIENVRLFKELEARNSELRVALEQQTATGDLLRVTSSSPTDIQPVFDAVAESATRLCEAFDAAIFRREGDRLLLVAHRGPIPIGMTSEVSLPLGRGIGPGRSVVDGQTVHVPDLQAELDEFPYGSEMARQLGFRTSLNAPLMRDGVAIGTITLRRTEARLFSDRQVALLQTFADQAVIAIENVRLFTELQEKNRALTEAHAQVTEALAQQTATGEILRLIAGSPTDLESVLGTVAETAARVCGARDAIIYRYDGDVLRLACTRGPLPSSPSSLALPLNEKTVTGRSVVERRTIHVHDLAAVAASEYPEALSRGVAAGSRTVLATPLLQDGEPLGAILIRRGEVQAFTDKQIALLKTFADQAVIAIENVRLFTELQATNRDLTAALDTQTATADILRVISGSRTDVQPVFDAIAQSAVRLLGGYTGTMTRVVGDQLELEAFTSIDAAGAAAVRASYPRSIPSGGTHGLAIRDRAPANIADAETDPRVPENLRVPARVLGFRSFAAVPLLLHGEAIGTIGVSRREAGGFTDEEIALLQTFADQAVIAIENARLLTELQARTQELTRSVEQLTALGEVGRAVSSTLDLETVLTTIVSQAIQLSGTDGGSVYEYDEATEEFSLRASRDLPEAYVEQVRDTRPRKGEGAVGRVAQTREPVQIADIADATAYESRVRNILLQMRLRALLAVPLIAEDQLVGALIVMRRRSGTFAAEEVALLQTFATQSALAIQNARLFREIEDKSRQLEVASQHKSEFLANMSHELRTPLNAIIGFSEVLSEKMFGELNDKQEEYSKDIHASGQHLLSLINDILDLSKIEAGRMELELSDFHLPTALDSALTLVRERAGRRSIALHLSVDERLGQIQGDERKVRQVVLNLLSNAIKFTPEGGRIEVVAEAKDGLVEVSVSDTGVGIAPEDQEAVFEEFRQVGTADKKVEGTGLGLTLCRKFVELHGGKIWVKSQPGAGSTFTFTIPTGT